MAPDASRPTRPTSSTSSTTRSSTSAPRRSRRSTATSSRTACTRRRPDSPERRSAQTAMYRIARALATRGGARASLHGRGDLGGSAGKEGRIGPPGAFRGLDERAGGLRPRAAWERLTKFREEVAAMLEEARQRQGDRLVPGGSDRAGRQRGALDGRPRAPRAPRARASPTSSSCRRSLEEAETAARRDGGTRRPTRASRLAFRKAARPALRPLLEGDTRGRSERASAPAAAASWRRPPA